jgi:ankyrin repeat protein
MRRGVVGVVGVVIVIAATAVCLSAMASCRGSNQAIENGQRGGEPERQLVQATVAVDLPRVRQLLTSGADPNKLAPHEGHDQSPWKLALHQARSNRPDTIAIVQAMLKSGASPAIAWGEGPSPRGGYTVQSGTPIFDAVSNGTPEVARALMQAGLDPRLAQVALENAVENGEDEIVHVLVEAGVDVNSQSTAITPLVAAIQTRNVALMTYLEEHGAREKP